MWCLSKNDEKEKTLAIKNSDDIIRAVGIIIESRLYGPIRYDKIVSDIQALIVIKVLKHSKSIQDCANKLGIKRTRLRMFMTKMGIEKS